jgi:1-deoxy-D-xylulose-5-phosphate reductoisomerase
MKDIFILGSTGSIGVNTLNVVRQFPNLFNVAGLSANSNIDLLEKQIEEFHPKIAIVSNVNKAKILRQRLKPELKCEILEGKQGLIDASKNYDYDILVAALVGFAGLASTIEGIKRSKRIALANKETLVAAGEIVTRLAKENNAEIIPVDSEHSAIFQCLAGEEHEEISKIILTASGGPFRNKKFEDLEHVTVEEALNHPNWNMGNKITIDSATMMNKGLEIIEAHWLFKMSPEKIDVVIHPQSIVHSLVEFNDGSIKAQLGLPDMRLPIQYALTYPSRLNGNLPRMQLPKITELNFYEPDYNKFECLQLAYSALEEGGTAPCILNAANEVAVQMFLERKIKFIQIPEIIKDTLSKIPAVHSPSIDEIFYCDEKVRRTVKEIFN